MARMNADVVGKVHNTRLSYKDGIMALFEALSNSIQSIEDAGISDGRILIDIIRKKSLFDGQEDTVFPVESISVTDNGVGFTEDNFVSFLNSDSTYKFSRGGKGVGRFSWLKVFDHATIDSVCAHNGASLRRYFEFVNSSEGIVNEKISAAGSSPRETVITLKHLKEGYLQKFPRDLADLADQIIEHLIMRLISPDCPVIVLRDSSKEPTEEINLNHRFKTNFLLDNDSDSFSLNNYGFGVGLLKVQGADEKANHSIYLSGNDRIVVSVPLSKYIPGLVEPLRDRETGELFCIKAVVSSAYLDANVNTERTRFSLRTGSEADNGADMVNEITLKEIEARAAESVKDNFAQYLDGLRVTKRARLESVVSVDMPHFLPLLSYDAVVDSITPNQLQDKNRLNLALQKAKYDILLDAKKEVIKIQTQMDNVSEENMTPETMAEYRAGVERLIANVKTINKSELSEYVIHRRMLLEVFEKVLSRREDGKYPWEEEIHNLIFPKGKTSEDMLGIGQNLWIIDERLSYHRYVSSDLPLDKRQKSSGRPDVMIAKETVDLVDADPATESNAGSEADTQFDVPLAYSDTENSRVAAYDSMVILEFKRAMRADYAGAKDPIDQIKNYIRELRDGSAVDAKGRPIVVSDSCRFYAYLICDLTPQLRKHIKEMHDFTAMVEGNGLFAMFKSLNVYIEVISYNKVLADSLQRNRVLFEKLQIDYNK